MPRGSSKKDSKKDSKKARSFRTSFGMKISNIFEWDNEGKKSYTFNAEDESNGYKFYGLRLLTNRDGEWFISFPSKKNEKDGNYYNHFYIDFDEDEIDEIIGKITG